MKVNVLFQPDVMQPRCPVGDPEQLVCFFFFGFQVHEAGLDCLLSPESVSLCIL